MSNILFENFKVVASQYLLNMLFCGVHKRRVWIGSLDIGLDYGWWRVDRAGGHGDWTESDSMWTRLKDCWFDIWSEFRSVSEEERLCSNNSDWFWEKKWRWFHGFDEFSHSGNNNRSVLGYPIVRHSSAKL